MKLSKHYRSESHTRWRRKKTVSQNIFLSAHMINDPICFVCCSIFEGKKTHWNIHYTPYHSIWQGDFDAIVRYNVNKIAYFF